MKQSIIQNSPLNIEAFFATLGFYNEQDSYMDGHLSIIFTPGKEKLKIKQYDFKKECWTSRFINMPKSINEAVKTVPSMFKGTSFRTVEKESFINQYITHTTKHN
jgi:hypothetical protein